jgi:hypothetical protein
MGFPLIKKRIRRALRAIGLLKPYDPTAVSGPSLPTLSQARVTVNGLYQVILRRDPDVVECEKYAASLASGTTSVSAVVEALLGSVEFGTVFSRQAGVAQALATAVLVTLVRVTDEASIMAYTQGLIGELPVSEFLREICESPDFRQVWGTGGASHGMSSGSAIEAAGLETRLSGTAYAVPGDIGQMVEGLIAARMIAEGAVLGLPPIHAFDQTPISNSQMISLIRTLDMLADPPVR